MNQTFPYLLNHQEQIARAMERHRVRTLVAWGSDSPLSRAVFSNVGELWGKSAKLGLQTVSELSAAQQYSDHGALSIPPDITAKLSVDKTE